jgi:hypothetical protein
MCTPFLGQEGVSRNGGTTTLGASRARFPKPVRVLHFREAQEIPGGQVLFIGIADEKGQLGDAGQPLSKAGADRGGV